LAKQNNYTKSFDRKKYINQLQKIIKKKHSEKTLARRAFCIKFKPKIIKSQRDVIFLIFQRRVFLCGHHGKIFPGTPNRPNHTATFKGINVDGKKGTALVVVGHRLQVFRLVSRDFMAEVHKRNQRKKKSNQLTGKNNNKITQNSKNTKTKTKTTTTTTTTTRTV